MFYAFFLMLSITQEWCKASIGMPVAILVDLRNGTEIGFETGEILRFRICCFELKCQPTQTYSEHYYNSVEMKRKNNQSLFITNNGKVLAEQLNFLLQSLGQAKQAK